jgi:deoxyadenosine/deoxycytidine kinase
VTAPDNPAPDDPTPDEAPPSDANPAPEELPRSAPTDLFAGMETSGWERHEPRSPRKKELADGERPRKYVAIAGNIGAGKSSLTEVLGQSFGWKTFYEQVDDNPYLSDFYDDMRRWSFNLQVYFLSTRFRHQREIDTSERSVVQDRSIYEDAEIFARNLYEMGLMTQRDFENYVELFAIMTSYLRPPSLLVYLRASVPTLVNHIQTRGRDYESTIRIDYLERLQGHYESWIERYAAGPKMIVDVDQLDFVHDESDRRDVVSRIEGRLFGLFPDEE